MVGVTDPHLDNVMANEENRKSEMRWITNIESLPDDLVCKILVKVPAQDIYKGAMLVNRRWYRMTHSRAFIRAHLHNSPHGLLLVTYRERKGTSVAIRQGRVEIHKFPQTDFSRLTASCNGLILQSAGAYHMRLYCITNPITRKDLTTLPPLPPESRDEDSFSDPTLGYLPSTMEYKVVVWYDRDSDPLKCLILTVGVDKSWREVCTQHISKDEIISFARLAQGFIHWRSDTRITTLNLETEVMTQTPIPTHVIRSSYLLRGKYKRYCQSFATKYYFSTPGKCLSVLVWVSQFRWDIWEVRSETGEWTKWGKIDLKGTRGILDQLRRGPDNKPPVGGPMVLVPAGWLEYREVLLFIFNCPEARVCILFNVRTQEIDSFELDSAAAGYSFRFHTNTLECLAPCI